MSVPMREPFSISSGSVSEKQSVILRLEEDGQTGWGEASAMGGSFYSPETPESCRDELKTLLAQLIGSAVPSMLVLEDELQRLSRNAFVRTAIETAAWEVVAKKRNMSLRELFDISGSSHSIGACGGALSDKRRASGCAAAIKRISVQTPQGEDPTRR